MLRKAKPNELEGLEDDDRQQILNLLLIYRICQISANMENIQFGLYCLTSHEKKRVVTLLKELEKYGAVFFRRQSKTYELLEGSGEDPYDLIDRFIADSSLHPHDSVKAFLDDAGLKSSEEFVEAKGFNLPYTDDKRFRREFVRAKDLGKELWDSFQKKYDDARANPSKSYEGVLVYALCEDEADVNVARDAARIISWERLAVSVPHNPKPFGETLLKVRACRHYLSRDAKISAQTESRMRDILDNKDDGARATLKNTLDQISEGSDSSWHTVRGSILVDKPQQAHRPADMLCEKLFNKRSLIKHPDLNLCHDDRWKTGKNNALKDAVRVLLTAERVMIDNGNPDSHGEKRYLEKVLLKGSGALKKTGDDGRVTYFTCESDSSKLNDSFPALKELCAGLENSSSGQNFNAGAFLAKVRNAPYGAGGTALILAFAHVIRAYGERLSFFKDSMKMLELPIQSYTDIESIVDNSASQVVISIRNISAEQFDLVNRIAISAGESELRHGEKRSLKNAYGAVMGWYLQLPNVSRIVKLYGLNDRKRLAALMELLDSEIGQSDYFGLLLERLPGLYQTGSDVATLTDSEVTLVAREFKRDIAELESAEQIIMGMVATSLCEVFGVEGDIIECEKVMTDWYKNLNYSQRDAGHYNDSDTASLISCLGQDKSFAKIIGTELPTDFGFDAVRNWNSLHIRDYAEKVAKAKEEIDRARIQVPKPAIEQPSLEIGEKQSATLNIPSGAAMLVYTVDGSDPKTSKTAQRAEANMDLAELLAGAPNVQAKIRALDNKGNYSDSVDVELIDKQRKYELKINNDMYAPEATFKCPNDLDGFVTVLKSLLQFAIDKSLLSAEAASEVEASLNKHPSKES